MYGKLPGIFLFCYVLAFFFKKSSRMRLHSPSTHCHAYRKYTRNLLFWALSNILMSLTWEKIPTFPYCIQMMKAGLNIQGRTLLLVTPAVSISKGQPCTTFQWLLSWLLQWMKRRLSGTNLTQKITCRRFDWMLMMTGAFSQNIGKLFSKLSW